MDQQEFLKQYFQTLISWVLPEGVTVVLVTIEGDNEQAMTRRCNVTAYSALSRKKLAGNRAKLVAKLLHARAFVQANVTLSIYPEPEVFSTVETAESAPEPDAVIESGEEVIETEQHEEVA